MILDGKGLSAWITDSEGNSLREYQVIRKSDQKIECWIPSEEGSNFKICWKALGDPYPGLDLLCQPWLDGVRLCGQIQLAARVSLGLIGEKSSELVSGREARLFRFGTRILTDEDDGKRLPEAYLDNLNTIRVEFQWGISGRLTLMTVFSNIEDPGPVNERAIKKGHAGSAGLGQTIAATVPPMQSAFHPDSLLRPVVFVFRYASREWLKAQEVIPPSPKPESPTNKDSHKRARSSSPEIIDIDDIGDIIDIDDLETDDDEVSVVKHLVPAPSAPNKKRKTMTDETIQPKRET